MNLQARALLEQALDEMWKDIASASSCLDNAKLCYRAGDFVNARVHARNADLTPEEAEELADEISRETIQRLIDQGRVVFQS